MRHVATLVGALGLLAMLLGAGPATQPAGQPATRPATQPATRPATQPSPNAWAEKLVAGIPPEVLYKPGQSMTVTREKTRQGLLWLAKAIGNKPVVIVGKPDQIMGGSRAATAGFHVFIDDPKAGRWNVRVALPLAPTAPRDNPQAQEELNDKARLRFEKEYPYGNTYRVTGTFSHAEFMAGAQVIDITIHNPKLVKIEP